MFQLIAKPNIENSVRVIEPVPYDAKPIKERIATFDTETDPFEHGLTVKPFTCGFATFDPHDDDTGQFDYAVDGRYYKDFWGADCVHQFFEWLASLKGAYIVYVHNGGNFDFYFCIEYIDRGSAPFIINGRLAKIFMQGVEFRDSYSLVPVALGAYQKDEIDYANFTVDRRELHRDEIRGYQRNDCFYLLELVSEVLGMSGDKLTMASIALPMLRSFHGFETMSETTDASLRPYYFGGRNQCFEVGEQVPSPGNRFYIYDVNSMYPYVMAHDKHPISRTPKFEATITERTHFAKIRAWSDGALPVRKDDGGLSFPRGYGDFFATIHEIKAGLDTGTLRISKVYHSIYFEIETSFAEFVDHFYSKRQEARANGDEIRLLYYKLVLNSSYGKLAQDPRKYENFLFDPEKIPTPLKCAECDINTDKKKLCVECNERLSSPVGWYPHTFRDGAIVYARPSTALARHGFYNVAAAASITGAARAYLLRGISNAQRPIYCDTDSIICEHLDADLDKSRLGAWKLEAEGDVCCIAGKKLYAVFNKGEPIKSASKGVKLTPKEIAAVCRGETIEYSHPVPKFHLDGSVSFIKRNINRTGVIA